MLQHIGYRHMPDHSKPKPWQYNVPTQLRSVLSCIRDKIVKIFEKDNLLNISIKDFGIGIPLNEQEKIFDKFYRTDKSRNKNSGGTGLGMSILKKIVDIHKGEITIKSEENKETTITLSFNNK